MVSTATISQALEGIDFPASREDMVQYAEQHNAPQDAVECLENLPNKSYRSMAEVWHDVGEKT